MGIFDLLLRLPGGSVYLQDFYELHLDGKEVPMDATGLLWACAYKHAEENLKGILLPALVEWTQPLNYFRSICQWKMRLYLDGMDNPNNKIIIFIWI